MVKIFWLLLASVVVFISHQKSFAVVEAQTLLRQYDDGDTKVTSPSIDVDATVNKDTLKIGVGYASDLVSSASADVRSYASKGKIEDKRVEFSGHFESLIPDGTIGLGYVQSDEDDYHSKVVSASGTREFFQKNTVVGMGFSNGQDRIESTSNPNFKEAMNHQNYSASLSQVLSRESIIELLYELRVESGFVASPYRRAKIINGSNISSTSENHPRTRNRNAIATKYNHFLRTFDLASATTYRYYFDSWGINSHTIEERLTREFGAKFAVSVSARYYTQTKATFYQDYYGADPGPFYTGNATLAAFDSILYSVRPTYKFDDKISIYLKFERLTENFQNTTDAGQISTLSDDKKLKIEATVIGAGLSAKF